MFVVVSYDIRCDKRRNKVADILLDYGDRVQFSVFECHLDSDEMNKLAQRISEQIDSKVDSVRFYSICASCFDLIRIIGAGTVTQDPGFIVV